MGGVGVRDGFLSKKSQQKRDSKEKRPRRGKKRRRGKEYKGGKWSQEIRWVGGVSHKISFDSFRKKKKKKTAIIHHFSPPSKVGTMRKRKRKERATKEGLPKGERGQDCLFLLRRGVGKREWGLKLNKK